MIIRIFLTITFLIIGYFKYKKSLIKEIEKNPKLIKNNKIDFTTTAIPYILFKVFVVYAFLMIISILLLSSQCNKPEILKTYEFNTADTYTTNTNYNQTYKFIINDEMICIKGIDCINVYKDSEQNFVEEYILKSDNKIINFLMYGGFKKGLNIYYQ